MDIYKWNSKYILLSFPMEQRNIFKGLYMEGGAAAAFSLAGSANYDKNIGI
jgi:hypothetical protein